MNKRQTIEHFHLLFLDQLGRKLDKRIYALKGGCNLRFFLRSIRYSEDIDIDIQTIRKDTLAANVRKILSSQPFQMALTHYGIEIQSISESKQTETTQRWKLILRTQSSYLPIPTKIEFSRRGIDEGTQFGPVDPKLIAAHSLTPILATHYDLNRAFCQKLEALAGRSETQARDIFDLYHLLNSGAKFKLPCISKHELYKAQEVAMSVEYEDYVAQVIAYLDPSYQEQYRDSSLWQTMVLTIGEVIQ